MKRLAGLLLLAPILLAACVTPNTPETPDTVTVTVIHDGETVTHTTSGLVVRDVLSELELTWSAPDRLTPGEFTPLADGMTIQIVRVVEELEIEEVVVPYEKQTVRNEGLPDGETRLLQTGESGVEEITYRIVYEDGVQVSRAAVRRTVLVDPIPEIVMVGAQNTFTVIPISGTLAYLSAGNAWVMRESSGSRKPLTITSDLDGRVFRASPEGDYLLFTRAAAEDDMFNSLWAIAIDDEEPEPVDLQAQNVLWADWSPTEARTVAYSTGEPRNRAPGWQANNDLLLVSFDDQGSLSDAPTMLLEASAGGIYGWYGTNFAWAPDGQRLAYAQADTIGLVDVSNPDSVQQFPIAAFPPFQTYSDWVWNPALAWSPDSRYLYTVLHGPPIGLEAPEDSPVFDVAAVAIDGSFDAALISQAGMWAAPVAAPITEESSDFRIAFLQAVSPLESVTSRYHLTLMDRDGSNATPFFPPEGETGLTPQAIAWSPDASQIALTWDGNLWVVDVATGLAQQLTGDGQTTNPSWTR